MSKPWFRLYAEFISDPKMQLLAFEDQRHYVAILCLKCSGILETTSISPDHFERMVSKALGLDPATGAEVKRRLMDVGIITESWQPAAWSKRQYESDSSAARTFQYRQRLNDVKRHSDVTVTDKNRSDSEQIQNRTDQNPTARKRAQPRDEPEGFAEFRQIFPPRAGSQPWTRAVRAWSARVGEGAAPAELIAGAKRYAEFIRATGRERTETVLQAATFLGPDKHFQNLYPAPAQKETAWDEIQRLNGGNHANAGRVFDAEPSPAGLVPLLRAVRG